MTNDTRFEKEVTIFFTGSLALIQGFCLPIILVCSAQHLDVAVSMVVAVLVSLTAIGQWRMLWLARRPQAIGTKRAAIYVLLVNTLEAILSVIALCLLVKYGLKGS